MSTTLKDWLKQTIADLKDERDATPGAVNEDAAMALTAMKLALASLEAEPVAWLWTHPERENDVSLITPHNDEDAEDAMACGWSVQPLYTAMLQGAGGNIGKLPTIKLPDISSKAFWSGTGKNETFHPETYRRWVKEAIEISCTIARVDVEVK
ncbi:hypothetical protein [Enterobacter hormaechei]|uniref:hypothetical protein n=1 Tax=Enterobacter cloacae complex TaxID=354276 RepID=UPI001E3A9A4F|nr:hypothetical protein [Enterobacter hormaechei]MDV5527792.1 hypothetical protein [Enterobacter hormaechei]